MIILNDNNFKNEIEKGRVLVDFYADWCGPCRMLSPVLEQASEELDLDIKKINVDDSLIAREYGVMSIPTVILFENGKEVKRHTGYMNLDEIKEFTK